jgi:kynurenine formamidase
MTLVDLSHELYSGMPQVPILPAVEVSCLFSIAEGKALNIAKVTLATHSGSHIDAPFHAFQDRPTIDQMPLDTFVGRGVAVPVQRRGGEAIPAADFENSGVKVERGDILLVQTGWDRHFTSAEYMSYPYLGEDACQWMVERGVKMVALDCLSPDMPMSMRPPDFAYPAHRTLLRADIPIIENLRNFGALEGSRFRVIALPLRIRDGDGAQSRVIAEPL